MVEVITNSLLWILALYGLFEIIKNIVLLKTYTNFKANGTYIIIAIKNQEDEIEGFMRSLIFKYLYNREEIVQNIMVVDLNSTDNTKKILTKLEKDYEFIKVIEWKDCKELINNIEQSNSKIS